jgi:hypothetical protein
VRKLITFRRGYLAGGGEVCGDGGDVDDVDDVVSSDIVSTLRLYARVTGLIEAVGFKLFLRIIIS